MKVSILILIILNSLAVFASPTSTVIDYLRGTPASVGGVISFDDKIELYKGKKAFLDIGMDINAKKGIGFTFSEKHLSINTGDGIALTVQGFPIYVTSVSYHEETGKFDVRTKTPLHIGEQKLNAEIQKFLDQHYKPKVVKAFEELKNLRAKQNLQDINQVVTSIGNIFSTGNAKKIEIPTIRGNVDLNFHPESDTKLKLNDWTTRISAKDTVTATADFVKSKENLSISAVEVTSRKGLNISGKTSFPEIASVTFTRMRADASGIKFDYEIGAEEVLTVFGIMMSMVKAYAGNPSDVFIDCDPVRLGFVRRKIDTNLAAQISALIRTHRETLLKGGITKEVIAAFQ